jgi:hypothetical protein
MREMTTMPMTPDNQIANSKRREETCGHFHWQIQQQHQQLEGGWATQGKKEKEHFDRGVLAS